MNKLKIVILLVLFLVCTTAGFSLAMGVDHRASSDPNKTVPPSPIPKNEANYLLIRVNDLTDSEHKLVSAWYVKIVFKPEPIVVFKPIFPSNSSGKLTKAIQKNFHLSNDHQLTNQFISILHDMKLDIDGYIITDDHSHEAMAEWAGNPIPITGMNTENTNSNQSILNQEKTLNEALCRAIKERAKNRPDIDWQSIESNHFHSSVPPQELAAYWQRLTDTQSLLCQVLNPR
jgi:hypothetical protein